MRIKTITARRTFVATMAAALLLAACGGDDATDETPEDAGEDAAADEPDEEEPTTDYPERDLTFSVGRSPGGAHDTMARQLAPLIEDALPGDVSVIVENVPGASGQVAAARLMNADPDGYEIQIIEVQGLAALQVIEDVDYDVREFTPIAIVNERPAVFAVPVDSEIETWEDLVAAGQERDLLWSTVGVGSPNFINGLIPADAAGIGFQSVPHDGATEAVTSAVRGDVDFTVFGADTITQYVQDGDLRALVQFGDEPIDTLPDVPQGADVGFPEFDGVLTANLIIIAPPNLPEDVRAILAQAVEDAVFGDEIAAWAEETGGLVNPGTAEDTERVIQESFATYESFTSVLEQYIVE